MREKARSAPMSVADFCKSLIQGSVSVNHDYQREENVWNSFMKSYFIESIILGYPIPKIFLYVNFDLKDKVSRKEIVDGQQRSLALRQFFENKLRISTRVDSEEFRGKLYRQLDPADQQSFLSYSLSIDEFYGVTEDEIREAFTRMNANNVALNPEELRNAKYKGLFKWFVVRIARSFREPLLQSRIISKRDIVRMADLRMFSEFFYILEFGIRTTKSIDIDRLYEKYDVQFDLEMDFGKQCADSVAYWIDSGFADYQQLGRRHIFYTFLGAIAEFRKPGRISALIAEKDRETVERILGLIVSMQQLDEALSAELAEGEDHPLREFIDACAAKTNVGHQKLVRYAYLLSALSNDPG